MCHVMTSPYDPVIWDNGAIYDETKIALKRYGYWTVDGYETGADNVPGLKKIQSRTGLSGEKIDVYQFDTWNPAISRFSFRHITTARDKWWDVVEQRETTCQQ